MEDGKEADNDMDYYGEEEEEMPDMDNGDEAISLYDVLVDRDSCLNEEELWALCRECCLVLEVVNNSPEMFQTLCVTPDTVAFDCAGNVCFLDLDKDPEPLYIPPEYSENGAESYKSHLFSLGMTLLYAAEYNGTPRRAEISPELRELFGCMTSEDIQSRPTLESVTTQCEEELCGKSSQEICCSIVVYPVDSYTPAPDINSVSLADVTAGLANYLQSQSSLVQTSDTPNLGISGLGPQQHSTPSASPFVDRTVECTASLNTPHSPYQNQNTDCAEGLFTSEHCAEGEEQDEEDMPIRGMLTGMPLPTGNRERSASKRGGAKPGFNFSSNLLNSNSNLSGNLTFNDSGVCDAKTSLQKTDLKSAISSLVSEDVKSGQTKSDLSAESLSQSKQLKPALPLKPSPVKVDTGKKLDNDSGMMDDSHVTLDVDTPLSKKIGNILSGNTTSTSVPSGKGVSEVAGEKQYKQQGKEVESHTKSEVSDRSGTEVQRTESGDSSTAEARPRRSKKKQGLTISEALESLNRDLTEGELWALCREGALALQRKKKHLPAYLSPDTLLLRENGNVSFKGIPEDKPLEVVYMAPELQQKGELTEKTCLYGLGVTLRCAGGKKYSSSSTLGVSQELQNLITHMADTDPTKRPTLQETVQFCDVHDKSSGTTSVNLCKDLFQEAFTKLMEQTNEPAGVPLTQPVALPSTDSVSVPKPKPKPPPKPPSPMVSAFRPVKPPSSKPQIGSGSAFAPMPVKPEPKHGTSVPTAYTSSATHFKPIVLHQNDASSSVKEKEQEKKTEEKEEVKDQPNEKDKEVVRKLKELKKNLMKHRQPGMAKELENEDKEPSSQCVVTPDKKTTKPVKQEECESKSAEEKPGSIDSLLSDIQKQGTLDTQTLASAIAQHLQNLLPKGMSNSPQSSSQKSDSGASNPSHPQQNQVFQNLNSQLPNLNIPAQYGQQLVGQTMTLPTMGQYGAGMFPGYPMQVQLQQDPRTGFLQLVPVGIMPMSGSAHGSRPASDEYVAHNEEMNESGRSSKQGSRAGSDTLPRARHGRTARDLVQKTANVRAKNTQQHHQLSPSSPQVKDDTYGRPRSAHNLDHSGRDADLVHAASHRTSMNLDNVRTEQSREQFAGANQQPQARGPRYNLQSNRNNRSNSSSPSPSKDSGVSGLNGVYQPPAPGSLMERLLNSNASLNQQKKIGRVVHLLREEFAFDGYMENGVEDVNMAEYITSLGNLKWETFISAITEKYPDLYWSVDLLVSLYESVNGIKPVIQMQSPQVSSRKVQGVSPLQQGELRLDDPQFDANKARSYRKRNADTAFNRTRGIRPQSAHALSPSLDTSDSTDNECADNRTRHRRKPMEKGKSASLHNLTKESSLEVKTEDIDISVEPSSSSSSKNDVKPNSPHPSIRTKSQPLSSQNTHINVSSTSTGKSPHSHSQRRRSDLQMNSVKRDDSQSSDKPHPFRKSNSANNSSRSSHSSSTSDVRTRLSRHMSQLSLNDIDQNRAAQHRRNQIIYHYAMMQLSMTEEVEKFVQDIDEENPGKLQAQLASLQQQVMMERKTKRKTQTFYNKLMENPKAMKGDQRSQVSKDIAEMSQRIRFLHLCQTHIEMLQAELHSIDPSYLYSLGTNPPETAMKLKPCQDNPLLQYQTLREPHTGCEVQMVQSGTVKGLASYLFASTALTFGFVHQFFFGFRYFMTPTELFVFLQGRHAAVSRSKIREANFQRIQKRVIDLLHFWVEGFYSVDFEEDEELQGELHKYLQQYKISTASEEGQRLCELFTACQEGHGVDLMPSAISGENVHIFKPDSQKKWDTLKAKLVRKSGGEKEGGSTKPSILVSLDRTKGTMEDVYFPKASKRTDAFTLTDYTAQCMAEQLTLIEQGMFQMTHPVRYLKSKSQGVSVALTMTSTRAPSMMRLNNFVDEGSETPGSGLDSAIQRMINHAQDISHWVAAEIVSCNSSKNQVALLIKFLQTAHMCKDFRNYATSMAILDGLENIIIKQLPTWKNLPSKYINIKEELSSVRMFLKNDAKSLMNHKDAHLLPTIPSVLFFLLHVQQLEIGSFQLANEMYKWGKIRSIVEVIDQIRIFKDQMYGYEADYSMQDALMQRIREFSGQDIHSIASQHETNFQKISSSGISAAFRKVKGKFQSK